MRISYSGLETFKTCPAKYKFQYLERIKVPKSAEAIFGTLIHESLRMFHDPTQPHPPSEEELLRYFTEHWNSDVYEDEQSEAFAFHQGIEMLKNYYRQNQGQSFNIVNLETPFSISLSQKDQSYQVTGRIDRIDKLPDGGFEVIDYKTSKKMPSQKLVDNDLQLSVYYLGILSQWPSLLEENKPVKLSLYYLKHGEKLSTNRTRQEVEETKARILEIISQINQSDFAPRSNPLCDWCPYQPYCPLFKHKFKKANLNDQQIKGIIEEYFVIKAEQEKASKRLVELKELINQYCDQQGLERVFSPAGYITRLPQKRFSYNLKQVKEILEPLGKWDEVITFDKTKFKQVVDSLPFDLKKKIDQSKILEKEFKTIVATSQSKKKTKS